MRIDAVHAAPERLPVTKTSRILLVDDDPSLLRLLAMRLKATGYTVRTARSGEEALITVSAFQPALVITDLLMDGMDGMKLFAQLHIGNPSLPVIVLTAHGTIPNAVDATQKGVFSYLTKPFDSAKLLDEVARALTVYTAAPLHPPSADDADGWCRPIVTRNPAMQTLLVQARQAAAFDVSVLIQSESGTGKELLAQAIHRASSRAQRPFIALNCSAVPEALLESELFGHTKGAFTGAAHEHKGLFQAASGGTLFLDEIGDMPIEFQAKLLRALQEKEVRPIGSTASVQVDVRILAATHRDLVDEVGHKRFREDLYYRLDVIQLGIPPLRERREDIPLLANDFLEEFSVDQSTGKQKRFSPEAMEALVAAEWPGNVRQLRNVVERTMVLSPATIIPATQVRQALKKVESIPSLANVRECAERQYLVQILKIAGGSVTRAAQLAQRNRTELYKLINRHHIDLNEFRSGA
ncbi:MAG: response regulator [Nevskiaceae bacterium]|nr:MAG: response regulator [Nevskiaceae bacterium]TBR71855.1 MAG: response regulator [Nevskiaceae bacterium]